MLCFVSFKVPITMYPHQKSIHWRTIHRIMANIPWCKTYQSDCDTASIVQHVCLQALCCMCLVPLESQPGHTDSGHTGPTRPSCHSGSSSLSASLWLSRWTLWLYQTLERHNLFLPPTYTVWNVAFFAHSQNTSFHGNWIIIQILFWNWLT